MGRIQVGRWSSCASTSAAMTLSMSDACGSTLRIPVDVQPFFPQQGMQCPTPFYYCVLLLVLTLSVDRPVNWALSPPWASPQHSYSFPPLFTLPKATSRSLPLSLMTPAAFQQQSSSCTKSDIVPSPFRKGHPSAASTTTSLPRLSSQ